MKKAPNAWAPFALSWVATAGMTGGFSPGRVLTPVSGTSAGTRGSRRGAAEVVATGGTDVAVSARDVTDCVAGDGLEGVVRTGAEPVDPPDPDVHEAQHRTAAAAYAVNVRARCTA